MPIASAVPSKVKAPSSSVPRNSPWTTYRSRDEDVVNADRHSTAVAATHDDVAQAPGPTLTVAVPQSMPKLTPATESVVPPDAATLDRANVTTGAAWAQKESPAMCAVKIRLNITPSNHTVKGENSRLGAQNG